MANLTPSDLRDPQPPVPGERERALVAARAHQLGRRRRLAQGVGALALVAALGVSVAALTAGGSSGPGATSRVEAASHASSDSTTAPTTPATTAAPTTVAPPPTTTAPAPTVDTTPSTAAQAPPAVAPQPVVPAATFTLSGTVTGNPAGSTVTLTVTGPGGPFTVAVDGGGNFSLGGLSAGDYSIIGQWVDSSGTATRAQRFGTVSVAGNSSVSLTFAP
jgi:hypothetical protein